MNSTELIPQDQSSTLSKAKLLLLFLGLQLALFLSFIDSTSVSTILPIIADDLQAASSITWAGTSFLIANTSFQIITSRLSDCFGRKPVLLGSLGIFGVGALLAGFARNKEWLYCARAVAGIGGGGINSLSMIIVSDVVPLRERGKYLTLLGMGIAAGSAAGPFLGAALATSVHWSWAFWIIPPMATITIIVIQYTVPQKRLEGNVMEKMRHMDWLGSGLSLTMTTCILVPLSGGGSSFAWNSPVVIVLLIVGSLAALAFIVVEGWVAAMPLFPARLLRNRNVCLLILQTFLVGIVFYGGIYFTPLYLQNVRGYGMLTSAALLTPLVVSQVFTTLISGFAIKWTNRARSSFLVGFLVCAAGQGAQICFDENTSVGVIVVCLLLQGLGLGATLQSTLVLAQASGPPSDRAAVTGVRNFARTSGGAIGLAVGNTILQNTYLSELPAGISLELRQSLIESFTLSGNISPDLRAGILSSYMAGLRRVFIFFTPVILLCLLMSFFVKDLLLDTPPPTPATVSDRESEPDVEKV